MKITLQRLLKWAPQLLMILFFAACSGPEKIDGLDSISWKNDAHGCKGERTKIWHEFAPRKAELMGYNEIELKALLGKPEKIHLPEKGQKVYYYYISGSAKCTTRQQQNTLQLQIRINATNKVSEVQIITAPL